MTEKTLPNNRNSGGDALKITLLGTGIPNAQINAFGTSTLIEAGDEKLLIDCGRGTAIRLQSSLAANARSRRSMAK